MIKSLLLIATTSLLFTGCFFGGDKEEKWTAFIYPDKNNTKRSLKSPMTFETLEECKTESKKQLQRMGLLEVGTYKCGLNCEYHEGMKVEVCQRHEQ